MCVCWHLPHVPGGCGRCWVPCCWRGQRLLHCESQQQPLPSTSRQGLLGVLEAAEAACGRREALPALLEHCIAASVEAAFDASLAQLSANVSAGGLGGGRRVPVLALVGAAASHGLACCLSNAYMPLPSVLV